MITALNEIKSVEQSTFLLDLFQYHVDETGQLRLLKIDQQRIQEDNQAVEEISA